MDDIFDGFYSLTKSNASMIVVAAKQQHRIQCDYPMSQNVPKIKDNRKIKISQHLCVFTKCILSILDSTGKKQREGENISWPVFEQNNRT